MELGKIAPPALPQAPEQYDRPYQDQLNGVHRLFYTRVMNSFNSLIDYQHGGQYLYFPYLSIQRTTDKTFTANTATQITFDQTNFTSGTRNESTSGVYVDQAGLYNYQFSAQFANTDTAQHTAWIWLRKTGVDIPGTARKFGVHPADGGLDGYTVVSCNFFIELTGGDYVELWAAVNNVGIYMEAYTADTVPFPRPSIPSAVAALTFVSAT